VLSLLKSPVATYLGFGPVESFARRENSPEPRPWRIETVESPEFAAIEEQARSKIYQLLSCKGKRTIDDFHRQLGLLLWDHCGMARNKSGLQKALAKIPEIREEYWQNVIVPGSGQDLNQSLERAGRVGDFLEFAELMVTDALERNESCGCHLREESQTPDNEALRDDENYSYVSVWEHDKGSRSMLHKEQLTFTEVTPSQRSYK